VDRLTRHQLKQDEFREGIEYFEQYFKKHAREILTASGAVVVVVGVVGGLISYTARREAAANADLGEALTTFRAYVGQANPTANEPQSFTTAQEKYRKALQQFESVVNTYKMPPRPKAAEVALYHAGICQSLLGDHAGAIRTLTEASHASDPELASLAKFALAGEWVSSGKISAAVKLYQELAARPTLSVPKPVALLAMGDAYRDSDPAQSRRVYERVRKEFSASTEVVRAVQQQIASLTP